MENIKTISSIFLFAGSILLLKNTMTTKATKNIATFVRGLPATLKNVDCEIKKKDARNAYNSPIYFFDITYIANGPNEHIDT